MQGDTPKVTFATPAPETKKTDKEEVLEKIREILKEYDGEAGIPITHEYWDLSNKYRTMK